MGRLTRGWTARNFAFKLYLIRAFSLEIGGSYPSPIQRLEIFDVEVLPPETSFIFFELVNGK